MQLCKLPRNLNEKTMWREWQILLDTIIHNDHQCMPVKTMNIFRCYEHAKIYFFSNRLPCQQIFQLVEGALNRKLSLQGKFPAY